jgi:hypothetical protein
MNYTYGSKIQNINNQTTYQNQNTTQGNIFGSGGLDSTRDRQNLSAPPSQTTINVCPPPPKVVNCRCSHISYFRATLADLSINSKSKQTHGPRLYRPPTLCEGSYSNCVVSSNSYPGAPATQIIKYLEGNTLGWILDFRYALPMLCWVEDNADNEKIIGAVRVMIYRGAVSNPSQIRYRKTWGWCAISNPQGGCADSNPAIKPPRAGTLPMQEIPWFGPSIDEPTWSSSFEALIQPYISRPPSVVAWTMTGFPSGVDWAEDNMREHGLDPVVNPPTYIDQEWDINL